MGILVLVITVAFMTGILFLGRRLIGCWPWDC